MEKLSSTRHIHDSAPPARPNHALASSDEDLRPSPASRAAPPNARRVYGPALRLGSAVAPSYSAIRTHWRHSLMKYDGFNVESLDPAQVPRLTIDLR